DIWQEQGQWARAMPPLERATGRLVGTKWGSLKNLVEERRRSALLVVLLEQAQLKASDVSSDGNRDYAGADRAYAAAFAGHGLDVAGLTAEEIARQLRTSAIRTPLVTGFDYWAYVRELSKGDGEPLRAIARLADDNAWRRQLRDPSVIKDREALK